MVKRKPGSNFLVVLCLLVFAAGCAGRGKAGKPVFKGERKESPKTEVTPASSRLAVLAVLSKEGPFQHPFTLGAAKLEGLLRAIYFQKSATFRWENPERVLTGPEAAALAREIVPALSSLGTNQLIQFRSTRKGGETKGEIFVKDGYLNFRILTIRGHEFLKKGTKATSHQWKLAPQEGQGFFPSNAVVWNPKEATNWIVIRVSDLSSSGNQGTEDPAHKPLRKRIDVFP